ncbi:hypothetical protein ACIBEJ_49535 [Nonomuraea sp. NPDC050790]|uniref:hypothetical protein n=1 Tax=Nonomuraea sp. NPDC050790 TaxID=3364371 RepID=UPI0037B32F88
MIALLVLSPIGAELLSAYLGLFVDPVGLLIQLAIAIPLYGTAAILIRELTCRAGRGWPTMLLLSAAFGLIQAGLIDQGLFNPHYIDDPSWMADRQPTLIPELDLSISYLVTFVGGHMLWSFGAPIAIVQAGAPRSAHRPWLGRFGLTVTFVAYLLSAALIFAEHTADKQFVLSPLQLGCTVAAVIVLVVTAFLIPRRSDRRPGRVPPPWLVGGAALLVAGVLTLAPPVWPGVIANIAALSLLGALLLVWSGREGWTGSHTLAAGSAPLASNVLIAFTVAPEGVTDLTTKYVSNAIVAAAVLALLAWVWRRTRQAEAAGHGGNRDAR